MRFTYEIRVRGITSTCTCIRGFLNNLTQMSIWCVTNLDNNWIFVFYRVIDSLILPLKFLSGLQFCHWSGDFEISYQKYSPWLGNNYNVCCVPEPHFLHFFRVIETSYIWNRNTFFFLKNTPICLQNHCCSDPIIKQVLSASKRDCLCFRCVSKL